MKPKGLILVSGGLDSSLAMGLMKRQPVELEAIIFFSIFSDGMRTGTVGCAAAHAARYFGIPLRPVLLRDEFIAMVRRKKHGIGAGFNPCIDCKILMLRTAKEYMMQCGASFVVTGEVLGERPMSQHKQAFEMIERDTGLGGLIVRPLSGRILPPTQPEEAGIITRDLMSDIQGRGRQGQLALARDFHLDSFPQPAGGCILTEKHFGAVLRDAFEHDSTDERELLMLRWGRQARLTPATCLSIGRNDRENTILLTLARPGQLIFQLKDGVGPLAVLRGTVTDDAIQTAAQMIKHFSKARTLPTVMVTYAPKGGGAERCVTASSRAPEEIETLLIRHP